MNWQSDAGPIDTGGGSLADSTGKRSPRGAVPDAALCEAQLSRILDSPDFDATERDRRFLAHVVGEALAGRADRIKAYTIALEVFGREPSFDPQSDPIVRVEAGHLRRALDRYYLTAGRADPLIIRIPKGGYTPTFDLHPAAPAEEASLKPTSLVEPPRPPRTADRISAILVMLLAVGAGFGAASLLHRTPGPATPDVPRLAIELFAGVSEAGSADPIAAGLTSELITEVARFKDIVVVATTLDPDDRTQSPSYSLGGSVAMDGDQLRVQARLQRRSDGSVLWADNYLADLANERPLSAESRIAGEVATAVGQPYGAIFQADAAERMANPRSTSDAYACTLAYFTYRVRLDPQSYASSRTCLEQAVVRYPEYATAWALLAQVHIDGRRWGFAPDTPLDQALGEARRALALEPLNVRAMQAKMLALYLSGDMSGALRVGEAALAINPNDTELTGEYGYRLALSGQWEDGCALMQEAVTRNPGPLPYFETGLALCAYFAGRYDAAAARIKATPLPELPIYHLVAAALFAEAGQVDAAHAERHWLTARGPRTMNALVASLSPRVGRPEDLARFTASLRKAGLEIPILNLAPEQ